MKLILITDIHIGKLKSSCRATPLKRFKNVISVINQDHSDADFCIITGDLTDLGDIESFCDFREALSKLNIPYKLLIGNHDNRRNFLRVFPSYPRDEYGFIQSTLNTKHGKFIFLDTVLEEFSSGWYCEKRQEWLQSELESAKDVPIFMFMHHPPFDVYIPSLNHMKLQQASNFAAFIEPYRYQLRYIFFGHVHNSFFGNWLNIPFTAFPSINVENQENNNSLEDVAQKPSSYASIYFEKDDISIQLHSL